MRGRYGYHTHTFIVLLAAGLASSTLTVEAGKPPQPAQTFRLLAGPPAGCSNKPILYTGPDGHVWELQQNQGTEFGRLTLTPQPKSANTTFALRFPAGDLSYVGPGGNAWDFHVSAPPGEWVIIGWITDLGPAQNP